MEARRVRRTRWLLAAALVAIAVITPAAAVAQPTPTELSISGNADYISPNQIIVYVTVEGSGGTGSVFVQAQQAQPPFPTQSGFGSTNIFCDGQRHTYAVSVFSGQFFPGWQLGEAEASANAFCPSGSDFETKDIRITRP
jgi:hypothetical protein